MNMFYTRADTPARVRAGLTLSSDQSTVRFTDYAHYGFDGFINICGCVFFVESSYTIVGTSKSQDRLHPPLHSRGWGANLNPRGRIRGGWPCAPAAPPL